MSNIETLVRERLFAMQDVSYKEFHSALMPTVNPDLIIGVRTPALRKFAAEFAKTPDAADFLRILPHTYYEENNLHAFLIEKIGDFDDTVAALNTFLPYVDNWATCDMMSPKCFGRHLPELLSPICAWLASPHPYAVRFGIGMLMKFYLDEAFSPEYPAMVAAVEREEYYIKMMVAWYFATALAKQYDAVLPYITERRLDAWTHNKAIQKAVESYRISAEQKDYLKPFKYSRQK